jgi:hypothetical protein
MARPVVYSPTQRLDQQHMHIRGDYIQVAHLYYTQFAGAQLT